MVSPNLGRPEYVCIDPELNQTEIETTLLVISDIHDEKEVELALKNKIRLIPIVEYKWRLKYLIDKKRDKKTRKKEQKDVKMKKGFFARWKERRKLKKLKKRIEDQEKHPEKELELSEENYELLDGSLGNKYLKLKARPFRGDPITPIIYKVQPVYVKALSNLEFEDLDSPRDYLLKHEVFKYLKNFYKVQIVFNLSEEVMAFLKIRDFIMFDIAHEKHKSDERINYHSLVISKKDWKDFTVIHATDLHLAERNDRIYGLIKNWQKTFRFKKKEHIKEEHDKNLKRLKEKKGIRTIFDSDKKTLKKRLVNPNNQFRKFIKIVNQKVLDNEVDFIALTGDIIDFTLLSKLPKQIRKLFDFDYDHSNWKTFKNIVLDLPQKQRRGMIKSQEIMCPIFTIPGNHDYRPFHYDIRWAGMYRKLGLKLNEALALNDKLFAFPISSITKSARALRPYLSEVNPSLDYSFRLGNNVFIFLNSGSDSWRNFRDLVTGHPSVTGLSIRQIRYLENLLNHKIKPDDNVFLFMHGPPINPKKKRNIFKRIQNKIMHKFKTKITEFKESIYRKLGKEAPDARIDDKFNVKYGTVSTNWESLIKFCKDFATLTIAGHTHALKEFRLADPREKRTKVFNAPPFSLKKVENPAAIYYDNYSDFLTSYEEIKEYLPFVVQTPALGLGGFKDPKLRGAYREIVIKNGKLDSFKVKFIS